MFKLYIGTLHWFMSRRRRKRQHQTKLLILFTWTKSVIKKLTNKQTDRYAALFYNQDSSYNVNIDTDSINRQIDNINEQREKTDKHTEYIDNLTRLTEK